MPAPAIHHYPLPAMPQAEIRSFAQYIARYLPGKIQKITVHAGFTCPNRDGSKGTGGCIYCNNSAFSPAYALKAGSIPRQIEEGKRFFARKYTDMRYVVYFQSYTSTNGPVGDVVRLIREALAQPGVEGVIIGTRPDCMPDALLAELQAIAREHFVMIEYGAESAVDSTLSLINRCHTWKNTADAVRRTAGVGIPVGLHLILGLPGESRADMMRTISCVNALPVEVVKFHQLQIVRGTPLASMIEKGEITVETFSAESYADLCCEILRKLRPDISIERFVSQSPASLLISLRWGLKSHEFLALLRQRLDKE